jgi:phosphoglycolate phosphatase-like HAD superfamily hydrolase
MRRKLLLFDIDGTLLRVYGAGGRAMIRAGVEVLGERCVGARVDVGGALDPWIFRELARHGGYPDDDGRHRAFRAAYARALDHELTTAEVPARAMPGVLDLLVRLRRDAAAIVGMLTGNYPETGKRKLRQVGIDPDAFAPTAWGDQAPDRPALVPVALSQAPGVGARDVIVIGDTPRDIACAHANGARCLAVATGFCSVEELRAAGADRVVADLSDPAALYEMIDSP